MTHYQLSTCLKKVVRLSAMNATLRDAVCLAYIERPPHGLLVNTDDAADQVAWVLDNTSHLVSGALIPLSGGSLP